MYVTQDLFSNNHKLDAPDLIILKLIFGSSRRVQKIIDSGKDLDDLKNINESDLRSLKMRGNVDPVLNDLSRIGEMKDKASNIVEWCNDNEISIISKFDTEYPRKFLKLKEPPVLIFCAGNLTLLNEPRSLAVVGSRKMSKSGAIIAKRVSKFFASKGVNIVSGLALGVDSEAHFEALSCGGFTTAIIIDLMKISPPSNQPLAKRILENNGLLLSENIPGSTRGEKWLYTMRNRLQSSMSKAVLIIEADKKSGTRSTADAAIEQDNPLYCADLSKIQNYDEFKRANSLNEELISKKIAKPFTDNTYQEIMRLL